MKTIVTIFLLVSMTLWVSAQHQFSFKSPLKLNWGIDTIKPQIPYLKFGDTRKPFENYSPLPPKKVNKNSVDILRYKSNMPIVKPGANYWNMPVIVPDSTVRYAIREKRVELIDFYNKKK